jgi:ABC-2 type transport system permease protein
MRTVLFLVQKEFLQIRRNRLMLPMMLVMPVFQMLLLSLAANYEVKNLALGVVDHDLSPMSRQLVAKFAASGYFRIRSTSFSAAQAARDLAADRTDLTLEIPPQFERTLVREGRAPISITANAINAVKGGLGLGYAGGIVRDFNGELIERYPTLGMRYADGGVEPNGVPAENASVKPGIIDVTYSNWYNPRLDYKTFMVPGILGEVVALIICFLTALNIVREREIGTIEQINVTPVRKWQFILGKLLPFWMASAVMMTVGLTVGWLVFRIPIEGDLSLIFLYTLTFAPCMLGLGFLISNFAATQQQAMFTAWFIVLIFILMCGLFTPVDSMPLWAQWINKLNPVQYFVEFMRLVLLKGAGFAEIQRNYFTVLAYALVVNALAVFTYRKRA